jgi:hypothetical protein
VALRHEWAHRISHDNLKRLLLLAIPDVLPWLRGLRAIDRAWARLAEWAADDRAVGDDSLRSVALAGALVRVARLGTAPPPAPLATSLLADGSDLAVRVDRLLHPAPRCDAGRAWVLSGIGCAAAFTMLALRPETLRAAHRLLELLVH